MASEAACYIGTSRWSYPTGEGTWKGFFYPAGTRDELAYYNRFVDAVEVNSSFYRPPAPQTAQSWVDRTAADFRFTVKLWQKFTAPSVCKEASGEAWRTGDAATRYRYLSDVEEIAALAERLKIIMHEVPLLFAFFNNHWQAYAPRNVTDLKRALGLPLKDAPKPRQDAQIPLALPDGIGGSVRAR